MEPLQAHPLSLSEWVHQTQAHPYCPELRPSAFEVTVLRIRFTDPEGSPQHVTYATTWHALPGILGVLLISESDGCPQAAMLREVLGRGAGTMLRALGCEIQGVDLIQSEYQEI